MVDRMPPRKKPQNPEMVPAEDRPPAAAPDLSAGAEALAEAGAELGGDDSGQGAGAPPEGAATSGASDPHSDRVDCPLCGTEGALSAVPRRSERYMTCGECAGHGVVLSGSLVDEAVLLPCESCNARGYVANPDYLQDAAASGVVRYPNPDPPAPPAPGMEWDSNLGMWAYPSMRPLNAA